jgi:hypothetical protein
MAWVINWPAKIEFEFPSRESVGYAASAANLAPTSRRGIDPI